MSGEDDLEDVRKVLAGDVAAFEGIVRRWQGPLVSLAWRFCHDRGRAEDLSQEAFLRAFRALGGWRREGAFSTWLFALATNLYRSELRRIPAWHARLDEVAEPADERSAERDLGDADRAGAVRRAVAALPATYREAMTLFYFHGKDVAATARSLEVPEGTVKARLARGRDLLRRRLSALHAPAMREGYR